jgi:hypothetical protein
MNDGYDAGKAEPRPILDGCAMDRHFGALRRALPDRISARMTPQALSLISHSQDEEALRKVDCRPTAKGATPARFQAMVESTPLREPAR